MPDPSSWRRLPDPGWPPLESSSVLNQASVAVPVPSPYSAMGVVSCLTTRYRGSGSSYDRVRVFSGIERPEILDSARGRPSADCLQTRAEGAQAKSTLVQGALLPGANR